MTKSDIEARVKQMVEGEHFDVATHSERVMALTAAKAKRDNVDPHFKVKSSKNASGGFTIKRLKNGTEQD